MAESHASEIEALAEGNFTKDQTRLMMQSLLADRFKLLVHFESQELPVFALTLANPGKLMPFYWGRQNAQSGTPPKPALKP